MSIFVKIARALTFVIVSATGAAAATTAAQSLTVDFPVNGRVIVEAREQVGHFPQMIFLSEKTRKTLLAASIKDRDKWLIPAEGDTPGLNPCLRFRVIHPPGY